MFRRKTKATVRPSLRQRFRRLVAWALVLGLVPVLALMALAIYVKSEHPELAQAYTDKAWDTAASTINGQRDRRIERQSLFIQHAHRLFDAGRYDELTVYLLDHADRASQDEGRLVATWLERLTTDGRLPALHLRARYLDVSGRADDAVDAYAAAELVARCDAARIADRSAVRRVAQVEGRMGDLATRVRADTATLIRATRHALALEEEQRDRDVALWIAGESAPRTIRDTDWHLTRQSIRAAYAERASD